MKKLLITSMIALGMSSTAFAANQAEIQSKLAEAAATHAKAEKVGYVFFHKVNTKKEGSYFDFYRIKAEDALAKGDLETAAHEAHMAKVTADAEWDQYNTNLNIQPAWQH